MVQLDHQECQGVCEDHQLRQFCAPVCSPVLDPKALRWDAGVTGGGGGAASGRATAREARPEAARGQVLLAVLTEFWLSDADEPLPDAAAPAGALEHSADMWGATDSIASLRCAGCHEDSHPGWAPGWTLATACWLK